MVKVVNIKEIPDRFINRGRLDAIKRRIQRLPQGQYKHQQGIILCELEDKEGRIIGTQDVFQQPLYPGLEELLINLKSDMEALITHVENADIENDILCERMEELQQCLELQQKQKK